ncbi:MAG: hypothetical protein UW58_C0013G0003 [Candidatus Collierbacteria bacterium GW2011_GWC2_44_30]|nr:MAG: hypothetical protein UW58_C0013G0003 [Candidatus Collierbacteria bacterium GW2011_GWC2_44_30]
MGDVLIIKDTWNNKFSLDLWHLLYSVFRLDYIKHGFFPVHASCVGKMGKTTLALRLMNDLDWQIFSGNKTFIDFSRGFHAIAGTKTVSIRSEDFNKYPNLVDDSSAFSDRIAFDLPARHISSSASVPISAIFIVKIDDGQDGIEEIISPSNLHLLYPFFLDTVYADTVLCGGEAVFSGNIDDSSKSRLSAFLRSALNKVKVYNLKGSVSFMADQVKNLT